MNIYAPNDTSSRRRLWEEILLIKQSCHLPWCIGGDLNEIKAISERTGCLRIDRGMRDLLDFINTMEVLDMPLMGRKFTWTNFQDSSIHSRIDRFLVDHVWMEKFKLSQWGLHRPISDHCPILLADDLRDWGPKPFRFLNIWLSHPKCLSIAKEAWLQSNITGWMGEKLVQKLKDVKERLKEWNKNEFGDINLKLSNSEKQLQVLDLVSEERQLNQNEKDLWTKTKADFWKYSKMAESIWRQKSRISWLKLGDKNTKFFQISANNRFRKNLIGSIRINGSLVESPTIIKQAAKNHFFNIFKESHKLRSNLNGIFPEC